MDSQKALGADPVAREKAVSRKKKRKKKKKSKKKKKRKSLT
jgi:hypothetical protein